ncbi:ATP-binding protein [Marinobacter sp. JSM 1782161]|uniref:ATP-binding protein n=1 Tax=Marinobacter sp. JSM 1782161 TaxID=2685906 RepID=UPI001403C711|nr:DUF87 domain-containing protein [Marinobacter sp. JSM 1782161]
MKFYTQTVVDYVQDQVERELAALPPGEPAELRVFTQSMPPHAIHAIFEQLEDYVASKAEKIECHLKVAYGLDAHWRENGAKEYVEEADRLTDKGWVDTEDRLTHYRNLTASRGQGLLLVVLAGIDHATDRGGLADFNVVNESVLLRERLNSRYDLWVERFLTAASLPDADGQTVQDFNAFFEKLFKIRPRNLFRLSEFLEKDLLPKARQCDFASDALALAYEQLPVWGIPPIFSPANPAKRLALLDDASSLFKRDAYREAAGRKKALDNLEKAKEGLSVAPAVINHEPYSSKEDFLETLEEFIQRGTPESEDKLLHTDFAPVIKILKTKTRQTSNRRNKPTNLRGSAFSTLANAVFSTLEAYAKGCGTDWAPLHLKEIRITIERFEFDAPKQGTDTSDAIETYRGLIGGIDGFLRGFELELNSDPNDEDSEKKIVPLSVVFGRDGKPEDIRTKGNKESQLTFRVTAEAEVSRLSVEQVFVWQIPPNHEERVRLHCGKIMHEHLQKTPSLRLPVIHMGSALDELYFAIDDEEAHRLLSSGMSSGSSIYDVLEGLPEAELENEAREALSQLSETYREFILALATRGYFAAIEKPLHDLVRSYKKTVKLALNRDAERRVLGDDLLRRLYQAFVCVPEGLSSSSPFVPALVATGITPAIAETVQAREIFLRDGLCETLGILLQKDPQAGKASFDRLLGLIEVRRPLYGLVFDTSRRVTTNLRSFGLIHRLGEKPKQTPTLAAQAEMRSEEASPEEGLSTYLRTTPESRVIHRTLKAYRQIHSFAGDRISIIAANVEDLRPIVAGIDSYINAEIKAQSEAINVPLVVTVRVIGRGPSATRTQEVLRRWQDRWNGTEVGHGRPCKLKIAYRPARTRDEVQNLLELVQSDYDVGFLFDFLDDQCGGDSADPTTPFELDWETGQVGKFPICEHPRLASPSDPHSRRGLVSNQRFKVAAYHAEITARLNNPKHPGSHHVIFNQVEYGELEQTFTREMHRCCRWVTCVDRFVDKALILDDGVTPQDQRKLVGFVSGVGSYGELNLTLSTESNTTGELALGVTRRLGQIYRDWSAEYCDTVAHKLMDEAQSVTGLSLISALGSEGVMRDVIGYAMANCLYLDRSTSLVSAALPLDSFVHWFDGAPDGLRPDLLLLEARVEQGTLVIDATVVECKVAQQANHHVEESVTQAEAGLTHLSRLFLPVSAEVPPAAFDRRYWWAQLHRALVVRNVLNIKPSDTDRVEHALERMAEGHFVIKWRAVGATFWTNDQRSVAEGLELRKARSAGYLSLKGRKAPLELEVYHAAIGQQAALNALLSRGIDVKHKIWPSTAAQIGHLPDSNEASDASKLDEGRSELHFDSPALQSGSTSPQEATPQTVANEQSPIAERPVMDTTKPETPESEAASPPKGVETQETSSAEPSQNLSSGVPERLLIGQEMTAHGGEGQPVYWEFGHHQLPNRHLLVFGGSGNGKTYAIQALLLEMAKAKQNSLVIDYTEGFKPDQLEDEFKSVAAPQSYIVKAGQKLPLDPFRRQSEEFDGVGSIPEKPFEVAKRIASIFTAVYSSLGEQQRSTLIRSIEQGVEAGNLTLERLYDQLKDDEEDLLANKIMPLARTEPFGGATENAWEEMFGDSQRTVKVLQLQSIDRDIQRLIIEFVLWDLWDFMKRKGSKKRPLPVVLDEVQNLDHRRGSPLEKYLREGRKFGASMILATQTLSNFSNDERDRLFQAAHKLFFAPASTELKTYATILRNMIPNSSMDDWATKLSALKKGECLSAGYERDPNGDLHVTVRKVSVTALSDRLGSVS